MISLRSSVLLSSMMVRALTMTACTGMTPQQNRVATSAAGSAAGAAIGERVIGGATGAAVGAAIGAGAVEASR